MKLQLIQSLEQRQETRDNHYISSELTTNFKDDSISYRLVSEQYLKDVGCFSKLGEYDGPTGEDTNSGTIYVNKNYHPTVIPFIAMFLKYQAMSGKELEKSLEIEGLSALDPEEQTAIALETTFISACEFLRPPQIKELQDALKNDPYYSRSDFAHTIIDEITEIYSGTSEEIVEHLEGSQEFYLASIEQAVTKHHNNRWVQLGNDWDSIAKRYGEEIATVFGSRVEMGVRQIREDPLLEDKAPELLRFVSSVIDHANTNPGEDYQLNPLESRFAYLLTTSFDFNASTIPFEFIDGEPQNLKNGKEATNYLRLSSPLKPGKFIQYMTAIQRRLGYVAVQELQDIALAIKGIDEFVEEVPALSSDTIKGAAVSAYNRLQERKNPQLEQKHQEEVRTALGLKSNLSTRIDTNNAAIAETPESIERLLDFSRAKKLLEKHGIVPDDILALLSRQSRELKEDYIKALTE